MRKSEEKRKEREKGKKKKRAEGKGEEVLRKERWKERRIKNRNSD